MVMVFVAGGALLRPAWAQEAADKPGVLFNITSGKEDLHAVTMALQLAGHALDDGREVTLFLNVRATEFASKSLSARFAFLDNPSIKSMFAKLTARGAHLVVCPHCMDAMGVRTEDLVEGAQVATRELLFGKLGAQTVVFTY
jgi:predicted peroxiredoxin